MSSFLSNLAARSLGKADVLRPLPRLYGAPTPDAAPPAAEDAGEAAPILTASRPTAVLPVDEGIFRTENTEPRATTAPAISPEPLAPSLLAVPCSRSEKSLRQPAKRQRTACREYRGRLTRILRGRRRSAQAWARRKGAARVTRPAERTCRQMLKKLLMNRTSPGTPPAVRTQRQSPLGPAVGPRQLMNS